MPKLCNLHGIYHTPKCEICNRHRQKQYDTTTRDKSQKRVYNSKRWKIARNKALIRDSLQCVKCSSREHLEVDHIEELKDNGAKYDLANLQTLCRRCHAIKTQRENKK